MPDRVSVLNVATKSNGDLDKILGSAYVPDPELPGELLVQFPGNPEGSYWILETDYHNYSVVYSCTDFLFGAIKLEFAWILAREKHLDPDMIGTHFNTRNTRNPTLGAGCRFESGRLRAVT